MNASQIAERIDRLFTVSNPEVYGDESGITYDAGNSVDKIGYCVNLTLETIDQAKSHGVDMMITHHPAWDEIYGLKEACLDKLAAYGISHYYNHLPLDDCSFGTNDSLLSALGLKIVERTHEWEGMYFGRVAEYDQETDFNQLVKELESLLGEPVKSWQFGKNKAKRVGLVCGNGAPTECLKESVENQCDLYMTGECNLYTIQYAQLKGINLIIGSHTFTEIFGVQSLAKRLSEGTEDLEIVQLEEKHYEANTTNPSA